MSNMFDGSRRVQKLLAASTACDLTVVYGGEEAQARSIGKLIPWRQLHLDPVLGVIG